MNVLVTLETRFDGAPDGSVWTRWGQYQYPFFTRYLEVFDQVFVIARVRNADCVSNSWERADGPGVRFMPIPYYLGPTQFAARAYTISRAVSRAVHVSDAAILRVPSIIGSVAERTLKRNQRPYGVEVVADPYDAFVPGAVRHPLRPFFRVLFFRQLRRQCRNACAAAYVTREALQRRYPTGPGGFHTSYSDVELKDDAFLSAPLHRDYKETPLTLIHVGTLAQLYKAPDVLVQAFSKCSEKLDLRLIVVGDGRHRAQLETLATGLGIREKVSFRGQLPAGSTIRDELDRAHLFVLPSRTEGMPRAMIEAMARGLPCIGSTVGGIPELIEPENLVPPGDVSALAAKIHEVVTDPHRMARMSLRNFKKARQYHDDHLRKPRTDFYRYVRESTEMWQQSRGLA